MNKITTFLKEVRVEMSKVSWPTKRQIIDYTLIVVGLTFLMAAILGLLDATYRFLLERLFVR